MLGSIFSDWFLFPEWLSIWRSSIVRCYKFEAEPNLCQADIWPWLSPLLLVWLLSFGPPSVTLPLPSLSPGAFDPAVLWANLFAFSSPVVLSDASLSCAVRWLLVMVVPLPAQDFASWKSHRNTCLPSAYGSFAFLFLSVIDFNAIL